MNSSTMEPGTALEAEFSAGPGRRLRQAREAAGMNLETVATKLRLDPKVVAAIEADDYAKLPAPAFVCGYIGNYARLLELPHEPLVAAYQAQGVTPPRVHATRRIEDSDHAARGWWRWIGYGIGVAFILAGVVAYWQGADAPPAPSAIMVEEAPIPTLALPPLQPPPGDDGPDEEGALNAQTGIAAEVLQPGQRQGGSNETGGEIDPPVDQAGVDEGDFAHLESAGTTPAGAETEAREVNRISEQDAPVDALPGMIEPGSVEPGAVEDGTGATPAEAVNSGTETATEDAESAPPSEPAQPTLVLKTSKDAWVSIRDANGKRLVYGLIEADETKTVIGTPPMRLVVGNAEAVTVTWNGQPFDKAPYTEKGVARFTVGGP